MCFGCKQASHVSSEDGRFLQTFEAREVRASSSAGGSELVERTYRRPSPRDALESGALGRGWGPASGSCSARSAAGKPHDVAEACGRFLLSTSRFVQAQASSESWGGGRCWGRCAESMKGSLRSRRGAWASLAAGKTPPSYWLPCERVSGSHVNIWVGSRGGALAGGGGLGPVLLFCRPHGAASASCCEVAVPAPAPTACLSSAGAAGAAPARGSRIDHVAVPGFPEPGKGFPPAALPLGGCSVNMGQLGSRAGLASYSRGQPGPPPAL